MYQNLNTLKIYIYIMQSGNKVRNLLDINTNRENSEYDQNKKVK